MRKTLIIAGATSIVSLAAGLVAGYKFAVHRLNDTYNEMMEEELEKTRAYYERNQRQFADPSEAVKVLAPEEVETVKAEAAKVAVQAEEVSEEVLERVLHGLRYNQITPAEKQEPKVKVENIERIVRSRPVPVNHNIFEGDTLSQEDDPQYDEMMDNRAGELIYLVSQEEHLENANEFEVVTLTFYDGDQVLVDEKDNVIENMEEAIGHKENLQFGRWSKDPSIVYIRNEAIGVEYEILRSTGKYSVEVLGLE